ncbi:MAG: ribosome-associated translation inhibitor RaiA [Intestinimonas sp.]|jgi:putative sigma-54 modulation protein|nr:ribosome-associated translation inhibitor RaiA [Intestinimonas sp.]
MKFTFTDKKVNLPQSVHAYAEKKVGKLDRYFRGEAEASITFSVEKDRNRAEVTVHTGSMILRASESTSDMGASIDAAVSSIERQIRKNKSRLGKRLRTDAFERKVSADISDFVPEQEEEYNIVRTKRFPMKPMTCEEAILEMNLVGHTFFAFRNVDAGGSFAVVYRRNYGGYGIIEDET